MLKGLLLHFAKLPDGNQTLNAGDSLKQVLYGKGVPDFNRCAYSTKSCATFILEDSITPDEIAWIPIYIPRIMKEIYGEKIMRVTLVYDPPVDRSIKGYTLVDLDFQLYKTLNPQSKPLIQRNWEKLYRKPWDSVKTDTFRWQKGGWGEEWYIMVIPKLRARKFLSELDSDGQRYALVVTLEDVKNKVDIYNAVTNERKPIIKTLEAYIQSRKKIISSATH